MSSRRQPPIIIKIFVAVAAPVFLFGLLELACRWFGFGGQEERAFGQFEEQVHVLLGRGIFVRDPDLFWRLQSVQGLKTPIAPGGLRVNSLGLRGPEWPKAVAPGVVRIVALGDSTTFGWRVGEEEAYPVLAGELLRQRGLRVEVIDGGVPGYTSFQAKRLLERDLADYQPKIVTLCFGWNELWPARGQPDVAQAVTGWVVDAENLLDYSHFYRLLRRSYLAARMDLGERRTSNTLPRVSPEQFRSILEELIQFCQAHSIELVLLTQPAQASPHPDCWSPPQHALLASMQGIVREVAKQHGLTLVDEAEALAPMPQAQTFVDCVHPSVAGHLRMAEALADALATKLKPPAEAAP